MSCLGLDSITINSSERADVAPAYELFPHVPRGALERPQGPIELLVEQDYTSLLASGGEGINQVKQLRAMYFESGLVLGGRHPLIKTKPLVFDS